MVKSFRESAKEIAEHIELNLIKFVPDLFLGPVALRIKHAGRTLHHAKLALKNTRYAVDMLGKTYQEQGELNDDIAKYHVANLHQVVRVQQEFLERSIENLRRAKKAFEQEHRADKPFSLLLGDPKVTGNLHYNRLLRAVDHTLARSEVLKDTTSRLFENAMRESTKPFRLSGEGMAIERRELQEVVCDTNSDCESIVTTTIHTTDRYAKKMLRRLARNAQKPLKLVA